MTDEEWLRRVTEHAYEKHHLKEDRFNREQYGQPLNLEKPEQLAQEIKSNLASGSLRYFSRMGGGFVAYDENKNLQIIGHLDFCLLFSAFSEVAAVGLRAQQPSGEGLTGGASTVSAPGRRLDHGGHLRGARGHTGMGCRRRSCPKRRML